MMILRLVGLAGLLVALAVFGHEVYRAIDDGGYRLISGGELWFTFDGNSLVGFQALIEKNVAPWLWPDIVLPILRGPAWAIPLVPGFLLFVVARRRRRRHRW